MTRESALNTLNKLIEQIDEERLLSMLKHKQFLDDVEGLWLELWTVGQCNEWAYQDNSYQHPAMWCGMKMWPNLQKPSIFAFRSVMTTLSTAQAQQIISSVFQGRSQGTAKGKRMISWRFHFREDGWVELTMEMH